MGCGGPSAVRGAVEASCGEERQLVDEGVASTVGVGEFTRYPAGMVGIDDTHDLDRKCVHPPQLRLELFLQRHVAGGGGGHLRRRRPNASTAIACLPLFRRDLTEQPKKESRANALLEILDPFAGKPSTFRTSSVGVAERLSAYSSQDSDRTVDRTTVPRRDPATRINLT